jgi:hypothetical protein
MIASFHILSSLLLTNHLSIPRYLVWLTDSVVKQTTNQQHNVSGVGYTAFLKNIFYIDNSSVFIVFFILEAAVRVNLEPFKYWS